jgi:tetratricopeptide (TPR) repeat protein
MAIAGPENTPVEHPILLAAKLVSDGHPDRAQSVITSVDIENLKEYSALYHSTVGSIYEQSQQWPEAINSFEMALSILNDANAKQQLHIDRSYVEIHLAHCHIELLDFESASDLLDTIPEDARSTSWYVLMNKAQQGMEEHHHAWETLGTGISTFEQNLELRHQRIELGIKLSLFDEVESDIAVVSNHPEAIVRDSIRIADTAQQYSAYEVAEMALRLGRTRGYNAELWTASAVIALKMEEWLMAADLLSVLSIEEPKFSIETAEAYRSAGRYHQALQYNGFAPSSKEKAQQRFSLLLELEQFSSAVALTDRLVFWKLTEDDAVLYGLAYAYFQLRDFEKALQYCNGITDPTVFQQSVALRQIIRDCQASNGCW